MEICLKGNDCSIDFIVINSVNILVRHIDPTDFFESFCAHPANVIHTLIEQSNMLLKQSAGLDHAPDPLIKSAP